MTQTLRVRCLVVALLVAPPVLGVAALWPDGTPRAGGTVGSLLLAAGLVVWAVAAGVMWWRASQSAMRLERAARRIASGDLTPIDEGASATWPLVKAQEAFEVMQNSLMEARQALEHQMSGDRRMREELQSLQRQLIRQERLAAVGLLVSGVAHEINNPLQAILGFAELLQLQHTLPSAVNKDLALIQRESARACGIIRNLALFARQQPGVATQIDLRDVITSVAELRQRRLESEDIEFLVEAGETRPVSAIFTELQQVALNFVVNAEQSILHSGRLPGRVTIRSYNVGRYVRLEVEDTGPGVPPDHEAKLFQPFFTTKAVGEGTGLGLSVSYGIIDSLGGKIEYRRAASGGAVFSFDLPPSDVAT